MPWNAYHIICYISMHKYKIWKKIAVMIRYYIGLIYYKNMYHVSQSMFSILCQDVLSYKLMCWNAFQFVKELRSSFSYECDLNWLHKEYVASKYTTEKVFCLHNVVLNRKHKDYFGTKYIIEFFVYIELWNMMF